MKTRTSSSYRVLATMVVAILTLAMLMQGCSSSSSQPQAGTPVADTKPYGSLMVSVDFGAGHLDPQIGSGIAYTSVGAAVFDSLLFTLPNGQIGPAVAEKWEISADGMAHTFYMRKGVKFHNGDDLTAADAKFSIERQMKTESLISEASIWRAAVASVDIKDDYTVVLRMKTPQYDLLRATEVGMTALVPKKYIETKGDEFFRSNLIGSGPWKVVSYTPGTKLELEVNENYWGQMPKFKNLTAITVKEEGAKVAMLKTGELDATLVSPDSIAGLKAAGIRTISYDGGAKYFMKVFYDMENPDKYAFGSQKVRHALQLAINSKELGTSLFNGAGEPYALYGVSPFASFFDPNVLKVDPFDPDGAKKLMAEAGYPNGFSSKVVDTGGGGILSNVHAAVQGYWRKIGIDASLVPMEYNTYRSLYVPKQVPSLWNTGTIILAQDRLEFQSMAVHFHSTQSVYKNTNIPRLDELIEKVPQTADPAQKKKLALEAALLAKNDYSTLSILQVHNVMALGSKIGEITPFRDSKLTALQYPTITHAK